MVETPEILLRSSEEARDFKVRRDRLVKIPYFRRLFESSWGDAEASIFQIEPAIEGLTYSIEKMLFVNHLEADWTIDPMQSEVNRTLWADDLQTTESKVYSYPWPILNAYPSWLDSSRNSIPSLVTLYKLADYYEVDQVCTAVEALLCSRWQKRQRGWKIDKPSVEDDAIRLSQFIEASKAVPQRGLLLFILTSICGRYILRLAQLQWPETPVIPGLRQNHDILPVALHLPASHRDYLLHELKLVNDSIDYQNYSAFNEYKPELESDEFDESSTVTAIAQEPFLYCLVRAHAGQAGQSSGAEREVTATFINLIDEILDDVIIRCSPDGNRWPGCVLQVVQSCGPGSSFYMTVGIRQLAWLVATSCRHNPRNYTISKATEAIQARLKPHWPSLMTEGLRMLEAQDLDGLEKFVHQERTSIP